VRVHVPATMLDLARLRESGEIFQRDAYAVTPEAYRYYADYSPEVASNSELRLRIAKREAAYRSLRELFSNSHAPRRRVVIVAYVPDEAVRPLPRVRPDVAYSEVELSCPVQLSQVVWVYVDDPDAEADVALAAEAIPYADLGSFRGEETQVADRHQLRQYPSADFPTC
jgi:hypothetical protein